MKLCCDRPNFHFVWKAGVDEDGPIIQIEDIYCTVCGAVYTINDLGESSCPLIHYTKDSVLIRVVWVRKVH